MFGYNAYVFCHFGLFVLSIHVLAVPEELHLRAPKPCGSASEIDNPQHLTLLQAGTTSMRAHLRAVAVAETARSFGITCIPLWSVCRPPYLCYVGRKTHDGAGLVIWPHAQRAGLGCPRRSSSRAQHESITASTVSARSAVRMHGMVQNPFTGAARLTYSHRQSVHSAHAVVRMPSCHAHRARPNAGGAELWGLRHILMITEAKPQPAKNA